MDDHLIESIGRDINQCFSALEFDIEHGADMKESMHYKAAKLLIKAFNGMVKLYYVDQNVQKNLSKGSVDKEYKEYLKSNE